MAASEVIITLEDDTARIRVVGEGTHLNALYLKKSYQNLIKEGVTLFTLDLTECTLLDSTFLGIFLGLALRAKEMKQEPVRVINPNTEILRLLRSLGLDRLVLFNSPEGRTD